MDQKKSTVIKNKIKDSFLKNRKIVNERLNNFFDWVKGADLVSLSECNTSEDPVRPELDNEFRTTHGRKIFGVKYKNEIYAIMCFAFTNEIPTSVKELDSLSKDALVPAKGESPLPDHFLWVPCFSTQKGPQAVLLLVRDESWTEQEIEYIRHLSNSVGHAMGSLKENNFFESTAKLIRKTWFQFLVIAGIVASMFYPVPM